jgi:hypothetical protein
MYILIIEVTIVAVSCNMADHAFGSVADGALTGILCILALLALVDFIGSIALAENAFLAAHVRSILILQLAFLTIPIAMMVAGAGYTGGPKSALSWLTVTGIFGTIVFWIWAYIQSQLLAGDLTKPTTKPGFAQQLDYAPGTFNDTRLSSAHIRDIIFGPSAWTLALVGFLVSGAVKLVLESRKRQRLQAVAGRVY